MRNRSVCNEWARFHKSKSNRCVTLTSNRLLAFLNKSRLVLLLSMVRAGGFVNSRLPQMALAAIDALHCWAIPWVSRCRLWFSGVASRVDYFFGSLVWKGKQMKVGLGTHQTTFLVLPLVRSVREWIFPLLCCDCGFCVDPYKIPCWLLFLWCIVNSNLFSPYSMGRYSQLFDPLNNCISGERINGYAVMWRIEVRGT